MLKYGWGVPRSQRDEIERMVSRVGLRTPMPPEYMEFHEKQKQGELETLREVSTLSLLEFHLSLSHPFTHYQLVLC
jgi:hypothetical protein